VAEWFKAAVLKTGAQLFSPVKRPRFAYSDGYCPVIVPAAPQRRECGSSSCPDRTRTGDWATYDV